MACAPSHSQQLDRKSPNDVGTAFYENRQPPKVPFASNPELQSVNSWTNYANPEHNRIVIVLERTRLTPIKRCHRLEYAGTSACLEPIMPPNDWTHAYFVAQCPSTTASDENWLVARAIRTDARAYSPQTRLAIGGRGKFSTRRQAYHLTTLQRGILLLIRLMVDMRSRRSS